MSCFSPNDGYSCADVLTGELIPGVKICSTPPVGAYKHFKVPCQQCAGCRVGRSRDMAVRCMHEAKLYEDNCFITLTYNDDSIPLSKKGLPTLVKHDFTKFMERLRWRFPDQKIREYHCGEYGPKLGRPHFHALIFNFDFADKILYKDNYDHSQRLFRSAVLESLWPFGFSTIGLLSFESASYVASYVQKKITGDLAHKYYGDRCPEFADGSRRPGIGFGWFNRFKKDVFPSDEVIVNEHSSRVPRYYDKQLEKIKPGLLEKIKNRRVIRAKKYASEQSLARRSARYSCLKAKLKLKKRSYENGSL